MNKKGPLSINEIKQSKAGEQVWGKFLLLEKQSKKTKDGKNMHQLRIGDTTGEIDVVAWENCDMQGLFEKESVVGILADVRSFNNRMQLNARRIKGLPEENIDDYLKTPAQGIEHLAAELDKLIEAIEDKWLKSLMNEIFDQKIKDKYFYSAAAKKVHHNYRGGLLEHSVQVAKICKSVAQFYPVLNADLIVSGAILHDLAKIIEFDSTISPDYSEEGRLLGHIVLGSEMIGEKISNLRQKGIDFPKKLELMLKHLILSHHGNLEFGSPVIPLFPEAHLLSVIDNLDAKLYVFFDKLSNVDGDNELFTPYDNFFAQYFYKYRYLSQED